MKMNEGFERLTLEQMEAMRESAKYEEAKERTIKELDAKIEEEAEKLAQEVVDSGLDVDDFEIAVDYRMEGQTLIASLLVVQVGREIEVKVQQAM